MGRQRARRDKQARQRRSVRPSGDASSAAQVRTCPMCSKQKSLLSFDEEMGCCIKCKYNRKCSACKNMKPVEQFDMVLGICAKCKAKRFPEAGSDRGTKPPGRPAPTRTRTCPVCLQKVSVTPVAGDWTIAEHTKMTRAGRTDCEGAGEVVFHEKQDALDHKVSGSFEGGRRR